MEIDVYVAFVGGEIQWYSTEAPTAGEVGAMAEEYDWGDGEIVVKHFEVDVRTEILHQMGRGGGEVWLVVPEDRPPF